MREIQTTADCRKINSSLTPEHDAAVSEYEVVQFHIGVAVINTYKRVWSVENMMDSFGLKYDRARLAGLVLSEDHNSFSWQIQNNVYSSITTWSRV